MGFKLLLALQKSNPGITTAFSTNMLGQGLAAPGEQMASQELLERSSDQKSLLFPYLKPSVEFQYKYKKDRHTAQVTKSMQKKYSRRKRTT